MTTLTTRSFKTYDNNKVMYFETNNGWFYINKNNFNDFLEQRDDDLYVYEPKDKWDINDKIITETLKKGIFKNTYKGYEYLRVILSYLDRIGERTRNGGCFTTYNDCLLLYAIFNNFNFKYKDITISFHVGSANVSEEIKFNSKNIDMLDFLITIKYLLKHNYRLSFNNCESIMSINVAIYDDSDESFIDLNDIILNLI